MAKFRKWIRTYKPDVVITTYPGMLKYIEDAGYHVPGDFGMAVLFRDSEICNFAGIDMCDEAVGAVTVDLVVQQMRSRQRGPLACGHTLLLDPVWRDGPSLPPIASKG